MYSVVLMMALAGSDVQPSGILFANGPLGRGGCSGAQAASFSVRVRQRTHHIFPLFHRGRSGGCGGGNASMAFSYSAGNASKASATVEKAPAAVPAEKLPAPAASPPPKTSKVYPPAGYRRMPIGPAREGDIDAIVAYLRNGTRVVLRK